MSSDVLILQADARHIPLKDECVQCVVTSPPYWGLRKYEGKQEYVWGGTLGCVHDWSSNGRRREKPDRGTVGKDANGSGVFGGPRTQPAKVARGIPVPFGDTCNICGAWRGGFGQEPTIELYVAHTVEVLREIRRVLRGDGILFWNVGDSYANDSKWGGKTGGKHVKGLHVNDGVGRGKRNSGLAPKNLSLIPARIVIAAQADGWYVRSSIIWRKPGPMPESVRDRPTRAHEYVFMLTKSEQYFYNWQEARDPLKKSSVSRLAQSVSSQEGSARANGGAKTNGKMKAVRFGGNKSESNDQTRLASGNEWNPEVEDGANWRDVWDISHEGYSGAHFAVMPSELARRCVIAGSKPGDLVLDPFGGSGTTARVAVELNRRAVSADLAYHKHAVGRTRNVQRNLL